MRRVSSWVGVVAAILLASSLLIPLYFETFVWLPFDQDPHDPRRPLPARIPYPPLWHPPRWETTKADKNKNENGSVTLLPKSNDHQPQPQPQPQHEKEQEQEQEPLRILHVVTSHDEYNYGQRNLTKGQDRLRDVVVPALRTFVHSVRRFAGKEQEHDHGNNHGNDHVRAKPWRVDIVLVLGYPLRPDRRQWIEDSLRTPPQAHPHWKRRHPETTSMSTTEVGLYVWDDAVPLGSGIVTGGGKGDGDGGLKVRPLPRALARQHRFVLADALEEYDLFSVWEDDMEVTAKHVDQCLRLSGALDQIRADAVRNLMKGGGSGSDDEVTNGLTLAQLYRILPGFLRVEILSPNHNGDDNGKDNDDVENDDDGPVGLDSNRMVFWETVTEAFGVRKLPEPIGWVGFMPIHPLVESNVIESYYGHDQDGRRKERYRFDRTNSKYMAHSAGYMVTQNQLRYLDAACRMGFLPPFDDEYWHGRNGLSFHIPMEFWVGGQLFNRGCDMQRVVALDTPAHFAAHLVWHTSNNKQNQLRRVQGGHGRDRDRDRDREVDNQTTREFRPAHALFQELRALADEAAS